MLAWQQQLLEEGHDVAVWISNEKYGCIGDGLVEKVDSDAALEQWGGRDAVYIFDYTTKGQLARRFRERGYLVVGADPVLDKLERDRAWAQGVAKLLGIRVPKSEEFKSLPDAIAWVQKRPHDERWFFKPGVDVESAATYGAHDVEDMVRQLEYFKEKFGAATPGLLQEKVDGVVIDTCAWWDGSKFVEPFIGMLEYKHFMPGETGPNTGCEICWVWAYDKYPRIAKELKFDSIAELFKRMGIPPGEYGLNAIVSEGDKKPYFLEWDPRFGYDEDIVYLPGLTGGLGDSLAALARGKLGRTPLDTSEAWLGVRVSVPPYPWEHIRDDQTSTVGVPIGLPNRADWFKQCGVMKDESGLAVADPYGLVGVVVEAGTNIPSMRKRIYDNIEQVYIPNLQYRDDAGEHRERDDIRKLKGWGYEVPPLGW
jgi:phosphoribosylamine-glycine ligase